MLAFLNSLTDALDSFVSGMEQYAASGVQSSRPHAQLALEHGIAIHRASLQWTRSAMAALTKPASGQSERRRQGSGPGLATRPDRTKFVT